MPQPTPRSTTIASLPHLGQPATPDTAPAGLGRALPDFLPGRLSLAHGTPADYRGLSVFHYRAGPPATWAKVVTLLYFFRNQPPRPVGIAILSWPTAVNRARRHVFSLDPADFAGQLRFANAHLRTISRVIVHPQFRGLGLATALIRRLIELCPTRYIEASAAMGALHPMFERAGLRRVDLDRCPAYFWLDRTASQSAAFENR